MFRNVRESNYNTRITMATTSFSEMLPFLVNSGNCCFSPACKVTKLVIMIKYVFQMNIYFFVLSSSDQTTIILNKKPTPCSHLTDLLSEGTF